ncbi:uncharacterized protein MYCFIDRAFT_86380 [Pseudocercospora fijiensis CIRAD86]|uniref:Uncharacterized protein n=1 Tax=Pseudocercospora fijiensis (strain CIRAD86) TaxID=383855 RepID=N1Q995_PSEFD|nr:uncharacterized protein MYCFIDRAFT_86380 [Pseudocercospora fijiensis CIRAD86]EME89470.1 hypothetical protein MYCFIDRAFT_86380 [Pseudocercospora fijiensis CIRAD86]
MPPTTNSPQFTFQIVSCLLAALSESGTTLGAKHYKIMAQIDGTKTASGYEHMFRAVKARAKEINEEIGRGEKEKKVEGGKNKRGRKVNNTKAKAKEENGDDDVDDEETPRKKAKVKKEKLEEEEDEDDDDDGLDEL